MGRTAEMGTRNTAEDLTAPFWDAVERGELVRPVCDSCRRSFFSPQVVCPFCQSGDWEYEPSVGTGSVYSHTTIHRPPDPSFDAPYVVADVEVTERWRLFTWIVNCDPADVHIDMAVQLVVIDGPGGRKLPAFEPIPGT